MKCHTLRILTLSLIASQVVAQAEESILAVDHQDLENLLSAIKPQRGESPWREIHWLPDMTEARRRAWRKTNRW